MPSARKLLLIFAFGFVRCLTAQQEPPSAMVREKILEIEKGVPNAILDLGRMNDRSAVPYLQYI